MRYAGRREERHSIMRIAYWDCFSGIAGDMNLGAMVGCGLSVEELREDLAGLALDGFRIEHRQVRIPGLRAQSTHLMGLWRKPAEESGR